MRVTHPHSVYVCECLCPARENGSVRRVAGVLSSDARSNKDTMKAKFTSRRQAGSTRQLAEVKCLGDILFVRMAEHLLSDTTLIPTRFPVNMQYISC
ncbi:hypothetical protein RRG08_058708 [Elysia crispata]|uniref:Uncharacterized protein n=1 Tax=Elysia crispata TaxID=231223 RepID=A0AAE0YWA9_9GAST|nr:hypothetical protein RRG08_058708 [Elysia crispata]